MKGAMVAKSPQAKDPDIPATTGPPEDIAPHSVPPQAQQAHRKPEPGWQCPPLPVQEVRPACPHIGRILAARQVHRYPLGAEWACTCGQLFVVAVNKGDKKTLIKKDDLDELAKVEPEPVEEPQEAVADPDTGIIYEPDE